ncbi:MAG: hypothetical protein IIC82_10005 [Chloroflexi bacterium]|nr:hypothetical protein [Chloroflexota bacterium]
MTTATTDFKSPWLDAAREKKIQKVDVDALIASALGPILFGPDGQAVQAPPKPPTTVPALPNVPLIQPGRIDDDDVEPFSPPDEASIARFKASTEGVGPMLSRQTARRTYTGIRDSQAIEACIEQKRIYDHPVMRDIRLLDHLRQRVTDMDAKVVTLLKAKASMVDVATIRLNASIASRQIASLEQQPLGQLGFKCRCAC